MLSPVHGDVSHLFVSFIAFRLAKQHVLRQSLVGYPARDWTVKPQKITTSQGVLWWWSITDEPSLSVCIIIIIIIINAKIKLTLSQ